MANKDKATAKPAEKQPENAPAAPAAAPAETPAAPAAPATTETAVTSAALDREEPYRIDKGEALPPFRNPNLNPDRAK